jgi:PRC-barrel domain
METERRETGTLIGSDKVEGTAVYGADAQKIGSIERVMIDKVSGQVSYAVLGFGGFLGIGDDHYPLPWQSLTYDTGLGGYRTNLTADGSRVRRSTAMTTIGIGTTRDGREPLTTTMPASNRCRRLRSCAITVAGTRTPRHSGSRFQAARATGRPQRAFRPSPHRRILERIDAVAVCANVPVAPLPGLVGDALHRLAAKRAWPPDRVEHQRHLNCPCRR